ncbi:MFS transporter [Streptomyces sp. NBC_01571]|uniref:MFS transporter n=1 Tax=Streptomyces sp. NBC_01571 TaxID=2975883 RepID=UPI002258C34C|nr:MFS transporter [Streptomyces sp. NBC_01571]MCX4580781.1 MFS transporter [Streptomyces sp. NBC_01571]
MPRPAGGGASYRAALSLPHARGLFTAAILARLCYGLLSLPLLLTLRDATGSYAVAGSAAGLFGLISALLGPARARLVERRPRALMLLAAGYAGMLAVIALTGELGAAPWLVFALAAVAGLFPPPVGPLMRSLWSDLAADPQQQQCALSLDTVSESTVFAVGPTLGAVLIGVWSAPTALAVCAGLVLVGFCALARALRRTSSRPHSRPRSATDPDRNNGATGQRPLRRTGFLGLLLLVLGSACALAVEEIAAVPRWGAATTGALLTLCSAGGVAGGLLYGRRVWRAAPGQRLLVLGATGTTALALLAAAPLLPVAAAALFALGACLDMLLITAYLLVDQLFPAGTRMEAGAWVNTAYNLGSSLGSALAGALLDSHGSGAAFTAATAAAGSGVLAAAAGGRCSRRRPRRSPALVGTGSAVHHGDLAETELLEPIDK